jgi:uncharacterized coiled-coil protein SlyX
MFRQQNGCNNCEKLSSRLSKLEVAATAGDKTIADLKELVVTYEKQLSGIDASQRSTSIISKSSNKQQLKSTK